MNIRGFSEQVLEQKGVRLIESLIRDSSALNPVCMCVSVCTHAVSSSQGGFEGLSILHCDWSNKLHAPPLCYVHFVIALIFPSAIAENTVGHKISIF